jgi:serine/threonine protein kinase
MAVTLTGIKGSAAQGGAGAVERFKSLEDSRAKEILASLKADLNGKTGVLRLLHTSKDADMKFQNADGMKHFAKGSRLDRTGDAVRTLLEKAGATKETLAEFDTYKAGRTGKGLESRQVVRFIETLKAESGGSVAEVLGKLGIRPPRPGDVLGEGAYGKVSEISYRGRQCVFKELTEITQGDADKRIHLPKIALAGDGPADVVAVDRMTRDDFMDAVAEYRYGEMDFEPDLLKEIRAYINVEDNIMKGKKKYTKEERAVYDKWLHKSDPLIEGSDAAKALPKLKLDRHGESAAAWMKGDMTQVAKPTVYVVRETAADGARTFHAVPGGKFFKTWSAEKLAGGQSRLEITGLVMERAKGKQLVSDAEIERTENRFRLFDKISGSQMKSVARSGLDALKQLSAHGFVHGDVKPANMIHDMKNGRVTLIDFSGMQKVSKNGGVPKAAVGTAGYLLPDGNAAGFPRDLFAMGVSLVETGLIARGRNGDASEMFMAIAERNGGRGAYQAHLARGRGEPEAWRVVMDRLEGAEAQDSAVAFGFACMRQAMEWDTAKFGRYDAAKSPADHPLNVLSRHPAVAGGA